MGHKDEWATAAINYSVASKTFLSFFFLLSPQDYIGQGLHFPDSDNGNNPFDRDINIASTAQTLWTPMNFRF